MANKKKQELSYHHGLGQELRAGQAHICWTEVAELYQHRNRTDVAQPAAGELLGWVGLERSVEGMFGWNWWEQ